MSRADAADSLLLRSRHGGRSMAAHRRRGIALIVVLALLAIVSVLAVTFVALSGAEQSASEQYGNLVRRTIADLEPAELFEAVLGQIVADTDNATSALRGHSLLRDMYGSDNDLFDERGRPIPDGKIQWFERYQRAFNGLGARDARVNYVLNGRTPGVRFTTLPPDHPSQDTQHDEDYDAPDLSNMFLALITRSVDRTTNTLNTTVIPSYHRPALSGSGADVLARVLYPPGLFPVSAYPNGPVLEVDNDLDGVRDSFWIDAGLPFLRTQDGKLYKPLVAVLIVDLDSKLNLNVHGQLNEDSVPGRADDPAERQGQQHRDLVDSHLDHLLVPPDASPARQTTLAEALQRVSAPGLVSAGQGASPTEVNLQNVFSPDPLFFRQVYATGGYSLYEYARIIRGFFDPTTGQVVPGRWGGYFDPPGVGSMDDDVGYGASPYPQAADVADPAMLRFQSGDLLLGMRWRPYRALVYSPGSNQTGLTWEDATTVTPHWFTAGTPMDLDGDGAVWVDQRGRLLYGPWVTLPSTLPRFGSGGVALGWDASLGEETYENLDEANEVNVYRTDLAGPDRPFTVSELALLYRYGDIGTRGLLDRARLSRLAPSLFDPYLPEVALRRRWMLTTESWDVIVPSLPPIGINSDGAAGLSQLRFRAGANRPPAHTRTHLTGILPIGEQWQAANGGMDPGDYGLVWHPGADLLPGRALHDDNTNGQVDEAAELGSAGSDDVQIPMELASGRRLNLHRPLIMPPAARDQLPYWASTAISPAPNRPDPSYDPRAMARDLYLALWLSIVPDDVLQTWTKGNVTSDGPAKDFVRRMAQYAVNFVDFVDPDDVMTGFEFDLWPLDGWDVDGNLSTNEGVHRMVVWGVEKPKVVISETLAYEESIGNQGGNNQNQTTQYRLWIELFNASDQEIALDKYLPNRAGEPRVGVYRLVLATEPSTDEITGEVAQAAYTVTFDNAPTPPPVLRPGQYLVLGPPPQGAAVPIDRVDYELDLLPQSVQLQLDPNTREMYVYLQRLAHPGHPHDAQSNPYITVDVLRAKVWLADAGQNNQNRIVSMERVETYSARHEPHPGGAGQNARPHTLGAPNANRRQVETPLVFFDHPVYSPIDLFLVPAISPPLLTTVFRALSEADQGAQQIDFFVPLPTPANVLVEIGKWEQLDSGAGGNQGAGVAAPFWGFDGNGPVAHVMYGYMWNFLQQPSPTHRAPTYHRLLELVEVPSPMNGSRDSDGGGGDRRRWRVPGKVNINTVTDPEVLLALLNNHPAALVQTGNGQIAGITSPEQSALWMSLNQLRQQGPIRSFSAPIANTILALAGPAGQLLLDRRPVAPPGLSNGDRQGLVPGATNTIPNRYSYPYHLFDPLRRLGNVITTRSSVFAVWITVGFFEVAEPRFPAARLDGVDNDGDGEVDEEDELSLDGDGLDNNRDDTVDRGTDVVYVPLFSRGARLFDGRDNDLDGQIDEADEALPMVGDEIGTDAGVPVRHRAFFVVDRSRADGWAGPPQTREELLQILRKVVIYSEIIE